MSFLIDKIKTCIRCIILGKYSNSEKYINYLRNLGCKIGERTVIFEPKNTLIDTSRPWLIKIGDDVKITRNVTILTHGYDFVVLRNIYNEVLGSSGKVTIGDNVFIGMNSTILKGVNIGSNVIIGANSLVNSNIPDNVVVTGNPARIIMTIQEYYEKRKKEYMDEAKELAVTYYERYHQVPPINIFYEFYYLFLDRDMGKVMEYGFDASKNMANPTLFYNNFLQSKPIFESYDKFLEWCGIYKKE